MRDLTTLFIEATLARGEWLTALRTLQLPTASLPSPTTNERSRALSHLYLVARTLAKEDRWVAALSTLHCATAAPFLPPQPHTYTNAYLASRVRTYHDVMASCVRSQVAAAALHTSASSSSLLSSTAEAAALRAAINLVEETFDVAPQAATATTAAAATTTASTPATAAEATGVQGRSNATGSAVPCLDAADATTEEAEGAAEELVRWWHATLRDGPLATLLSKDEKTSLSAKLAAASQAALRGITQQHAATVLSSSPAPSTPLSPSSSSTCGSVAAGESVATTTESGGAEREHAGPPPAPPLSSPTNATDQPSELQALLHRTRHARGDWAVALRLLTQPSAASPMAPRDATALMRLLTVQGRNAELTSFARTYLAMSSGGDTATAEGDEEGNNAAVDAVVLKTVAESCRRLREAELAADVLQNRRLRAHLTPSAAVPLIMTLRNAGQYAVVLHWWRELRSGEQTTRYPLLQHAKLSSYVASCVVRQAREAEHKAETAHHTSTPVPHTSPSTTANTATTAAWEEALKVFEHAERSAAPPALLLMFQLRLMREEGEWQAAMALFSRFRQQHPPASQARGSRPAAHSNSHHTQRHARSPPDPLDGVFSILTSERVEHWVPADALRRLKQQVRDYRSEMGRAAAPLRSHHR